MLRLLTNDQNSPEHAGQDAPHIALLEYDERFAVLQGFVQYDFHSPLKLPCTSSRVAEFF